jgi:outer membrane protein assembly factor BamB
LTRPEAHRNDIFPTGFDEGPSMTRRCLALLALPALLLAAPVRGEDWPEFRGPAGAGLYGGTLPTEWGPTRNVAWKQAIPGAGWSSPVVSEGRIYLTTAVPPDGGSSKDQSLQALCLDAATGKLLWQKEVFHQDGAKAPPIHGKNSHASSTPLISGGQLFVHFGHQGTACLDAATGNVLWQNTSLRYQPVHGNGGSPVLANGALVFSVDGADQRFVVALDRGTGKVLWKTDRDTPAHKSFSFGTPLAIEVNGREQLISPGSDVVAAYDPATGKEIWHVHYNGYSVIPRPVYGHGLVFLSTGFDSPVLLAIRPDGKGDVTDTHVAWKMRKNAPLTPSPLLVGDELYTLSDGGVLSCLDAATGRAHYQQRLGGTYSASPLFADGKIYVQSEDGTGTVVKAGRQFEELARNALDERSLASYAAADGALFVRTAKHLYRIESR